MTLISLLNECKDKDVEYEACVFIITETLNISKSEMYLHLNEEINEETLRNLKSHLSLYIDQKIPVQYITGYTYFYGLKIKVTPSVLIPRFETEEVVDYAIKQIKKYNYQKIIDVGTGSGCIAIALKKNLPQLEVMAVDISSEALKVAKENAALNNVDIDFRINDLLTDIEDSFDMIISNPPYISKDEEVMDLVYLHEPHLALFSDNGGLYHYEMILKQSKLNKNGMIIFEIAYNKADAMHDLVHNFYPQATVLKDIRNNDRIMIIQGEKK